MVKTPAIYGYFVMLFVLESFVSAQDIEASPRREVEAALAEYSKYIDNTNANVRKAAVEGLFDTNHPDLIKVILKTYLNDPEDIVKKACVQALGRQSCKDAVHELTRILKLSAKLEERILILEAFKMSRPAVAYDTILNLTTQRTFELRFHAAQLLSLIPAADDRAGLALTTLCSDAEPQIRLIALESLAVVKHPSALDLTLKLMSSDTDWRVRAAAINSIKSYRAESSIQPLIDAIRKEDGRLKDDAHAILKALTGLEYSGNPDVWQGWWDRVKANYKVPTIEELRRKKRAEDDALAEYKRPPDHEYTPYHGIKTRSKRMLFIIDISGSMGDRVILAGTNEAERVNFAARYKGAATKIDVAREEMIETVAALKDHVRFNIVLFHSEAKTWKPSLVPATAGNKNEALKFLARLTPQMIQDITLSTDKTGRTNTFDALAIAFGLGKEPGEKPSRNHTVESDTVFLLSDGMPTEGRITDPEELVRFVQVVNSRLKIVIHTITFGHGNAGLLKPIAELSGGKYVEIGK